MCMYIHTHVCISRSLSLSLSVSIQLYIYIYIYNNMYDITGVKQPLRSTSQTTLKATARTGSKEHNNAASAERNPLYVHRWLLPY